MKIYLKSNIIDINKNLKSNIKFEFNIVNLNKN